MFKGLIFLLYIISTSIYASGYAVMIEPIEDKLVLSIDGKRIALIDEYGTKSKDEQLHIIVKAMKQVEFCSTKAKWGSSIAEEAKDKIGSVDFHINYLHQMLEGSKIPQHMIVDNERMIREAYRSGYKDPYQFGVQVIKDCLVNGF